MVLHLPSVMWAILFLVALFVVMSALQLTGKIKDTSLLYLAASVVEGVVFWVTVFLIGTHRDILGKATGELRQFLGPRLFQIVLTVAVAALGLAAYAIKKKFQRWYGFVEMMVAIASAYLAAGNLAPNRMDLARWATLAGAVYFVARGRENYSVRRSKGDDKKLIAGTIYP